MTLFRTVAPEVEPVTLVEVKQNLRIAHDSEDDLLTGLIRAAREDVEAACGLALINQQWRLAIDELPRSNLALLRRYPVRTITSVTVYGEDGEASLVNPDHYLLQAGYRPARLRFRDRLQAGIAANGIEIDFEAGYGEAGTDVPSLLTRAIIVLVAHWYEFRATYSAREQPVSYPPGYDRLIGPWRMRRL
jgi:uncharacterized phiE125 gp8 family phage protein